MSKPNALDVLSAKEMQLTPVSWLWISGGCALTAIVWAYWPTLTEMVHKWETQPDYSHGYLVVPIALLFLWIRRSDLALNELRVCWWGVAVLIVAATCRLLAGLYYLAPLDGWTLPLAVAGIVLLLYGPSFLRWSFPSIVFLWFMVPLPFSVERWLSVPLQAIATNISTIFLVMLGQPAIAEGNIILLGDHALFVEEACSGLRIFVGVLALSFAFVLFSRWLWWQKAIVLLATLPVALLANVFRIVVTGLLYQWVSNAAGQQFSHDLSGFIMIPLAAAIFGLLLVYLNRLFPLVEDITSPGQLFRTSANDSE